VAGRIPAGFQQSSRVNGGSLPGVEANQQVCPAFSEITYGECPKSLLNSGDPAHPSRITVGRSLPADSLRRSSLSAPLCEKRVLFL